MSENRERRKVIKVTTHHSPWWKWLYLDCGHLVAKYCPALKVPKTTYCSQCEKIRADNTGDK